MDLLILEFHMSILRALPRLLATYSFECTHITLSLPLYLVASLQPTAFNSLHPFSFVLCGWTLRQQKAILRLRDS